MLPGPAFARRSRGKLARFSASSDVALPTGAESLCPWLAFRSFGLHRGPDPINYDLRLGSLDLNVVESRVVFVRLRV